MFLFCSWLLLLRLFLVMMPLLRLLSMFPLWRDKLTRCLCRYVTPSGSGGSSSGLRPVPEAWRERLRRAASTAVEREGQNRVRHFMVLVVSRIDFRGCLMSCPLLLAAKISPLRAAQGKLEVKRLGDSDAFLYARHRNPVWSLFVARNLKNCCAIVRSTFSLFVLPVLSGPRDCF